LEYLDICRMHPDTASLKTVQTHVKHFVESQSARCRWFHKFCERLDCCTTSEDVEALLRSGAVDQDDRLVTYWKDECDSDELDESGIDSLFEA